MLLFGAVMTVLLIGSIETTFADHLEGDGNSLLAAMQKANIAVALPDSKYQIHLQTVIRDEDGYLIQVSESTSAAFVPHKLTDQVFDTLMGKVKPVTIDGIEYDKVTFTFIPNLQQRFSFRPMPNSTYFKCIYLIVWSIHRSRAVRDDTHQSGAAARIPARGAVDSQQRRVTL